MLEVAGIRGKMTIPDTRSGLKLLERQNSDGRLALNHFCAQPFHPLEAAHSRGLPHLANA